MHEKDVEEVGAERQCTAMQAWPLRSLETQGQLTQGTDK